MNIIEQRAANTEHRTSHKDGFNTMEIKDSVFWKNLVSRETKFMCKIEPGKEKTGGICSHLAFLYTRRILCLTEKINSYTPDN